MALVVASILLCRNSRVVSANDWTWRVELSRIEGEEFEIMRELSVLVFFPSLLLGLGICHIGWTELRGAKRQQVSDEQGERLSVKLKNHLTQTSFAHKHNYHSTI